MQETGNRTLLRLGGFSFVPVIFFSSAFTVGLTYIYSDRIPVQPACALLPEVCLLVCGLTLLYLAGIKYDLVGWRYPTKLLVQTMVASFLPLAGIWINNLYGLFHIREIPAWAGIPFTVLLVIFIINALDFIDNVEGMASGLSAIALTITGGVFLQSRLWLYALVSFSTLGVLVPFFCYSVFGHGKRYKKIGMGTAGSLTLGYLLSFLSIRYAAYRPEAGTFATSSLLIPFSTLLIPLAGILRILFIRFPKRRRLFLSGRERLYRRIVASEVFSRRFLFSVLGMSGFFNCINLLLVSGINNTLLLSAELVLWWIAGYWLSKTKSRRRIKINRIV